MSDLTDKFTALETQLTTQHTELMTAIGLLQGALDLVASNTDLALENGAANTKALLAALGQTGACFPCPTPSIDVPPTGTTTTPIDSEHCKRSQWIVTAIQGILAKFDTLQSFNVPGTFSVLNDAISQIVGAIGSGDTIPLPSFPETVQLVGTYVNYAGERAFSGVSLSTQFAPLYGPLVTAVNLASNATDARAAYVSLIEASSASSGAKQLFEAIAYNALWTYAMDATSTPDLDAFDGTACGLELPDITSCTNFGSSFGTFDAHTFSYLNVPPTSEVEAWGIAGDYNGWSFEIIENEPGRGTRLFVFTGSGDPHLAVTLDSAADPFIVGVTTIGIGLISNDFDDLAFPFVVRICPPS